MENNIDKLFSSITQSSSATFCSIYYESKGTGEVARHTINLNVNLENLYSQDLETLMSIKNNLNDSVEIQACNELIESFEDSLKAGIGNNVNYSQKNVDYKRFKDVDGKVISNVKQHPNGQIYLSGLLINKDVIEQGQYVERKSKPLTIAKNKMRKDLKTTKFRNYVLDSNTFEIRVRGNNIIFDKE